MSGRFRLFGCVVALATLGAALSPAHAASDKRSVLTIGVTQDIDNLNPYSGVTVAAFEVWTLEYDELLNLSADGLTPIPELATEVPKPENGGTTWTYHLRKDVKWSDGVALTADDVVYTLRRVQKEQWTNFYSFVQNVTHIDKVDDYTVRVTTAKPNPQFPLLQVYILPKHVWEKYPTTKSLENFTNTDAVSSGPFHLAGFRKGQSQKLVANKHYFGGAPKIDEIIFRVFDNEEAKVQALKNGEIDAAYDVDSNLFNQVKGDSRLAVQEADDGSFSQITINTGSGPVSKGHPALRDLRVRQAIAHAVDKQVLVDSVLNGQGVVGQSMNVSLAPHFDLTIPKDKTFTFDLTKARQILEQAGYKDTNGDGVREMNDGSGKPLRFSFYARSDSKSSQAVAEYVKGWLKDIGIAVDVKVTSEDELTPIENAGTFDMAQWSWTPYVDPDTMMSYLTCAGVPQKPDDGLYNDAFYCSPKYDELYHAQQYELDPAKREQLVKEAQQVFYDDVPYVVIYRVRTIIAYDKTKFSGFTPVPRPNGPIMVANNFLNYMDVREVGVGGSDSGTSTGVVIVIIAAVLVLGAAGALVAVRRRRTGDERD